MNVLVTGGAGFIGSHVVESLIGNGFDVTVLDDLSGGLERNLDPKAKFVKGSITDARLVDKVMKGKQVVYHLAAYAAEGLSHFIRRFNYTNNLIGTMNLINSAVRSDVDKFLFTSSMAVYGKGSPPFKEEDTPHPEDPYGIAKHAVELDLRVAHEMFGLEYIIIRPHNVYGERQFLGDPYRNVIGIFMNRIMQGKQPLIFGDGEQTRAFSYVGDIIPCIASAPFIGQARNQTINLGAGTPYTLNQLAEEVIRVMGVEVSPIHVPPRTEIKHAHCLNEKAKRILGYEDKTSLQEGLSRMAAWAKTVGPQQPTVWEGYELTKNLPEFWKSLGQEYPNAGKRIRVQD